MSTTDLLQIERMGNRILQLTPIISQKLKKGFWQIAHTNTRNEKQDISTSLDHEIGRYITESLFKEFKGISIDSEEKEERKGKGAISVLIDPVDGTKHVINGIDLFGSMISINYKKQTHFGLIINPFSEKYYYAFKGKGAFLNAKKIHTGTEDIKHSFVFQEEPTLNLKKYSKELFAQYKKYLMTLIDNAFRLRNIGLSSTSIGLVAEGAISAFINFSGGGKIYDFVPAVFIAEEAGAIVSDMKGNKIDLLNCKTIGDKKILPEGILVANPIAHKEIVSLFRSV